MVCDVTDETAVRAAIGGLRALDILVNNAGTNIPQAFVDVESAALDTMLNLNVRAAFIVAQAAVKRMLLDSERAERGGAVVNISSQLGRVALRGRSVYTMTKHAIEGMTKSMAIELARDRIRVNAVAPAATMTERLTRMMADQPLLRSQVSDYLLGPCDPIDIAQMALYLASDESPHTTGQIFPVDSGVTIS